VVAVLSPGVCCSELVDSTRHKSGGIYPLIEAAHLSRVLVAVDKGLASVGRTVGGFFGDSCLPLYPGSSIVSVAVRSSGLVFVIVLVKTGRQQQGGRAFVVVGNVVGQATRAVFVLAFSPVICREGQGVERGHRGGRIVRHDWK